MHGMRYWIDLINEAIKPASAAFIARITADTEENRKYLEDLERAEKELEDEEQRAFDIPQEVRRSPEYGTKEWEQHHVWLQWELDKDERERELERRTEQIKAQHEYDLKVQGIRLAAKDAMDDMIEQDREVVSKLAQQALKSQQQQRQRVKKQAMRRKKK